VNQARLIANQIKYFCVDPKLLSAISNGVEKLLSLINNSAII